MTAVTRHRTPRERQASESARIAGERAQANAERKTAPEPRQPVEPVPVDRARSERLEVEAISPTTAWRRRCVEIREEIEREKRGDP